MNSVCRMDERGFQQVCGRVRSIEPIKKEIIKNNQQVIICIILYTSVE